MSLDPRNASQRDWFVSYDVTHREIVLQYGGDDQHAVSMDEALLLSDELRAAVTAANEHRWLRGDESPEATDERDRVGPSGRSHADGAR